MTLAEELLKCGEHVCDSQQHIDMLEKLYSNIVMSLTNAARQTYPLLQPLGIGALLNAQCTMNVMCAKNRTHM